MKRTLVYHLYCGNDFSENIANKIHQYCLSKYASIFDEMQFTIAIDDISNTDLIRRGIEWVLSVRGDAYIAIKTAENTLLCEVNTFNNEVLKKKDELDGAVFFAHNKGTTNIKNMNLSSASVFRWICGMYYYNFEFIDEVMDRFQGKTRAPECFYGTFLTYFTKEKTNWVHSMPNNLSGLEYAGTFYWMNMPKIRNSFKMGIIKDVEPDSRFFAEEYPGMFFDRYAFGCGMTSHNDSCFNAMEFNPYYVSVDEWETTITDILGEREGFLTFVNEVKTNIGLDL